MKKRIIFYFLILVLISSFVSASDKDTYFENIKFGMNMNKVIESIDLEVEEIKTQDKNNIKVTSLIYQANDLDSKKMYSFSFFNNRLIFISRVLFSEKKEVVEHYKKKWGRDISLLDGINYIKESKDEGIEIFELNSPNYLGFYGIVNSSKVDLSKIDIPEKKEIPSGMNYMYSDQVISKKLLEEIKN